MDRVPHGPEARIESKAEHATNMSILVCPDNVPD